jgi:hypothetical protein
MTRRWAHLLLALMLTCCLRSQAAATDTATEIQLVFGGPVPDYAIGADGDQLVLSFPASAAPQRVVHSGPLHRTIKGGREHLGFPGLASRSYSISRDSSRLVVSVAAATEAPRTEGASAPAAKSPAATGTGDVSSPEANYKQYTMDLSVPASPAFTVLGVSPETVTRPASLRDLQAALVNGIDKEGKLKSGIAVDVAPFALLWKDMSIDKYRAMNWFGYTLANTQVSFGTTQGTTDSDKSLKVGLGLHIVPWNLGDPYNDVVLTGCFRATTLPATGALDASGKPIPPEVTEAMKQARLDCYKNAPSRNWNRSAWLIGLGGAWTSDSGSFDDSKTSTRGAWTSFAYGFENLRWLEEHAQFIVHLRRLVSERVKDPLDSAKFMNQDSDVVGVRLRMGTPEAAASIEGSYQRLSPEGRERDKVRRLAVGFEYKIAKDVWFVASVGGEGGRKNGENKSFVLGSFRFASSSNPAFSPTK